MELFASAANARRLEMAMRLAADLLNDWIGTHQLAIHLRALREASSPWLRGTADKLAVAKKGYRSLLVAESTEMQLQRRRRTKQDFESSSSCAFGWFRHFSTSSIPSSSRERTWRDHHRAEKERWKEEGNVTSVFVWLLFEVASMLRASERKQTHMSAFVCVINLRAMRSYLQPS